MNTYSTVADIKALVKDRLTYINPKHYVISGMEEVWNFIIANKSRPFFIIGDYDADGVFSTTELVTLLGHFGITSDWYCPHRFTDGYGANPRIVQNIPDNAVVILVDNGIVAFDAVKAAKAKNCSVIILDHHLGAEDGTFPDADFIIDPNAVKGQCEFTAYCGAGLVYKLAEVAFKGDEKNPTFLQIANLASFGTVGDCVDLVGENWLIVRENIKNTQYNLGLISLCQLFNIVEANEGDAGFKICPALNAPGRLLDDGASLSVSLLLEQDFNKAKEMAKQLKNLNEERKRLVDVGVGRAEEAKILRNDLACFVISEIPEGIVGIVAGRMAEKYRVPTFCFAYKDKDTLKGSARTYGENHLKCILDGVADQLSKYGGHKAAAGLTLPLKNLEAFMDGVAAQCVKSDGMDITGIRIKAEDAEEIYGIIREAAPFGQANPQFSFTLEQKLIPDPKTKLLYRNVSKYKKLLGKDVDILCFDVVPDESEITDTVEVTGNISQNVFMGKTTTQIEALRYEFK